MFKVFTGNELGVWMFEFTSEVFSFFAKHFHFIFFITFLLSCLNRKVFVQVCCKCAKSEFPFPIKSYRSTKRRTFVSFFKSRKLFQLLSNFFPLVAVILNKIEFTFWRVCQASIGKVLNSSEKKFFLF